MNRLAQTRLHSFISKHPDCGAMREPMAEAFERLARSFRAGGKLLVCGNGGSAADGGHIAGELMKSFLLPREMPEGLRRKFLAEAGADGEYLAGKLEGALPVISLAEHTALMTAVANDTAGDMIFAQQVYGYARPEDCFWGISTSGNSADVVYAALTAKAMGLGTIGMTGKAGGRLKDVCGVTICAPAETTAEAQEYHIAVYHTLCMMLEEEFFGEDR
ncbi:MAG: SIS domain-containing protein [Firmicutes bacterium]|nr:SIS domain-containing protein [Bacillota bacterium]